MMLSGCGVAKFYEETYTAENYLIHNNGNDKVWLYVASTNTTKDMFPFYYSAKRLPPYSIYIRAHSSINQNNSISIAKVSIELPDQKIIDPVLTNNIIIFSPPHEGAKYSEGSVSNSLSDSLPFYKGKEIKVCVSLLIGKDKIDTCKLYKGTKHVDTKSNFSVYMSV